MTKIKATVLYVKFFNDKKFTKDEMEQQILRIVEEWYMEMLWTKEGPLRIILDPKHKKNVYVPYLTNKILEIPEVSEIKTEDDVDINFLDRSTEEKKRG